MQVKTYVGATTQEVMARIKNELGNDAVILGNRTYKKNGVRCHEFTVGIEREAPEEVRPEASGNSVPPGWSEWHKDWKQIKEHLFALMKPSIQLELLSPRQRVALEYLQREGVADSVVVELYRRLRANTGASVLEVLSEMVEVRTWGTELWEQRVHCIAGPFGVGKTTAALRLALLLRKQQPEMRIAFINADCQRGNGRLTLRHWAELSDFTYVEAQEKQGMAKALTATADADRVFVDMPGLTRGVTLTQARGELGLLTDKVATHTVFSPHYDCRQSSELLDRYHIDGEGSLIWTKLDEAESFGALPNVAVMYGKPISALSFGSGLRDSLLAATESLVWRLIFKRQLPGPVGPAAL